MTENRIHLTTEQVHHLASDLRGMPDAPVGEHLSDDEFVDYAAEMLDSEQIGRIDQHMESCPACTDAMLPLVDAAEAWRGEHGRQRLAALRARLLGDHGRIYIFSRTAAAAAATPQTEAEVRRGATADGRLRWTLQTDETNLYISFGSHELALEGRRFRMRVGEWREVELRRIAADQLGADLTIPLDTIPVGIPVEVDPLDLLG
jgi:hypothetical protein